MIATSLMDAFTLGSRLNALLAGLAWAMMFCTTSVAAESPTDVFPGVSWETRTPAEVGLVTADLEALAKHVGGRGCVVRHGYLVHTWGDQSESGDIASAVKPIISTLLLMAVQDGSLTSVDEPLAKVEPRLRDLNNGKDARITWRHLASQTSGYGLKDAPGDAYAYNDFALALYYDSLMNQVYRQDGTEVLRQQLGDVLGFQDRYTFDAFNRQERAGRLAISVRDLARFGLLYLRQGRWKDRQVLSPELIESAIASPIPATLPRSAGHEAEMLPGQRSLGGGKNQAPIGPGVYTFNWWVNRTDTAAQRLYVDAPSDAYGAFGHGGQRALWIFPSFDLIVAWNDSPISDHDASPGNPSSGINQAARIIRGAMERRTRVAIEGDRWLINGQPIHQGSPAEGRLMNVRMVNATYEDANRPDFDAPANTARFVAAIPNYVAAGVRGFTLNLQGGMPGYEGAVNTAFRVDGSLRSSYMERVRQIIEACDEAGAVVILGGFYQRQDQHLQDEAAIRAGVANVAQWIKGSGFTNVVLELANEFPHDGFDHALLRSPGGQLELIGIAKRVHPELLASTSGMGDGECAEEVANAADFLLIHFNGTSVDAIPGRIEALRRFGKPIVCNEDDKTGAAGAAAARQTVKHGASWGYMNEAVNQHFPFRFDGPADDQQVYDMFKELTSPR